MRWLRVTNWKRVKLVVGILALACWTAVLGWGRDGAVSPGAQLAVIACMVFVVVDLATDLAVLWRSRGSR